MSDQNALVVDVLRAAGHEEAAVLAGKLLEHQAGGASGTPPPGDAPGAAPPAETDPAKSEAQVLADALQKLNDRQWYSIPLLDDGGNQ